MIRIIPLVLSAAALLTASTAASAQDRWHRGDHDWHHGDGDWHHGDRDGHHRWGRGWGGGWYGGWGGGWGYRGGSYVSVGVYPYGYGWGYGGYFPGYASYPYPIYSYPEYPTGYLGYEFGGRRHWGDRDRWRHRCDRDGDRRC